MHVQIPTSCVKTVNRLLKMRRRYYRRGGNDPAQLASLESEVKVWTRDTEAVIRKARKMGLRHQPRSVDEIALLSLQTQNTIASHLAEIVDVLRASVFLPVL